MKAQKTCATCGVLFTPYARARQTQKTCSKSCRAKRCKEACYRWRKEYPNYFKGRYPNTKRWLAAHKNYLRRYRARNAEYVAADNSNRGKRKLRSNQIRADIQNGLLRREIAAIRTLKGADIQNTLRLHVDGLFDVLAGVARADIQMGMGRGAAP